MGLLQRRVSFNSTDSRWAWIDVNPPDDWDGTIMKLIGWLTDNADKYTGTTFRVLNGEDYEFRFSGHHIEVCT